ncbi:MAG: restriction endonuclease [archaeon]
MTWQNYERTKARKHRGTHVGGPGKEDYRRGSVKGEVKHWKRPVTKPEVKRIADKGVKEICNLNGFTKPAQEYARRRNVKLFKRGKRVA